MHFPEYVKMSFLENIITMLQITAGQWAITANLWLLTTHIYHVMTIVTGDFSKKC